MTLLAEYALTPDVFDVASYSSEEVAGLHMQTLKDVLLHEAVVRDLRDGAWSALFADSGRSWHRWGKELLKKLATQRRLHRHVPVLARMPATDRDWGEEAVATHAVTPLNGVITGSIVAAELTSHDVVSSIQKLPSKPWWASSRSSSVRLARTRAAFQEHLALLLRCANSIMFIDPHFDPEQPKYRDLAAILGGVARRGPRPLIEMHRRCYTGSGPSRQHVGNTEWERKFRQHLGGALKRAALAAEVFIWDDLHDRYVISDLLGITVPYGFDTTTNPKSRTIWTRLARDVRDDVQREFDPASAEHRLVHQFSIP